MKLLNLLTVSAAANPMLPLLLMDDIEVSYSVEVLEILIVTKAAISLI